jgi:periplasmic protein TonB
MFDNLRHKLDFDDLLFESRNKDYGAYQLRKRYNGVVAFGVIVAALLVSTAVILPFILTPASDTALSGGRGYIPVKMETYEPPIDQVMVPPAPPPEMTRIQEIVKYVPPVVVDSIPPLELTLPTSDQAMSQTETNQLQVSGNGTGDELNSGAGGNNDGDAYFIVEVMPSFKGGDISKFRDWVGKRTNYPQAAIDKKIRGTVYLTFIVEKDGSVSNVVVQKGVDPLIDYEAVKAISESPKWTPGLQRGQPVRVRFSIPLNFMF